MHPVQGLHLIAVFCNKRISRNIVNCYFTERIHCKDRYLKQRVQRNQPKRHLSLPGKLPFRKKHSKNKKTDQHKINTDKIDTGHNGHAEIAVIKNTDQITDIYYSCACTGTAQIPSRIFVFLNGFHRQNYINQCNQNRKFNITSQKYLIHTVLQSFLTDFPLFSPIHSIPNVLVKSNS